MMGREVPEAEAAKATPQRPQWLDDEPDIVALLSAFVDKLEQKPISERARIPGISITRKVAPKLFRNDEASDRTWALLRSLEGQVFEIRPNRKRQPYDPEYLGATLRFAAGSEAICRAWLGRPRQRRYREAWMAAVSAQADVFADRGASLSARPVRVAGKSAADVVLAFTQIGNCSSSNLTLRQLSARLFWGHSKLLDARQDLLRQLYPALDLAPRAVLVHVYLPPSCKGVLFVENQDTYAHALAGSPAAATGLALVYAAGFKGGADRIRSRAGVSLHYQGASDRDMQAGFESWWFDDRPTDWPVWFWGDLDYSGMTILKTLRQRFGDVQAWQAGYAPMLQLLRAGGGHTADIAEKTEQVDPGVVGCPYADQTLLPALRKWHRCVDQEAV